MIMIVEICVEKWVMKYMVCRRIGIECTGTYMDSTTYTSMYTAKKTDLLARTENIREKK